MIRVETVFRCQDGQVFNSREEAEKYEREGVKEWLSRSPQIDIAALLEEADNEDEHEYWATDHDIIMEVVYKAWARRRKSPRIDPITEEEKRNV